MLKIPKNIDIEIERILPMRDLVAFEWIKPKTYKGFILPENYGRIAPLSGLTEGLRLGRFYYGRVNIIGSKVIELKKNDIILVHEYGIINYGGEWKEDHLYFIEEKFIKAIIEGYNEKEGYAPFDRPIPESLKQKFGDDKLQQEEFESQVPRPM